MAAGLPSDQSHRLTRAGQRRRHGMFGMSRARVAIRADPKLALYGPPAR